MKFQIKTDQNMDYKVKEYINQSCGYIWKSNKIKENYNFYDYESQESLELYVIEGFPESKFKEFINTNIEGISIGYNGAIDIKDVLNLCPNIRTMFLDCDMIINAEFFQYFNNLEYLSFIGNKNEKVNLILPLQLKSFVCIWKSKYQLNLLPDNKLEYLKIENGISFDFNQLLNLSPNLIKIELFKCVLINCLSLITKLNYLRYLSITNCKIIEDVDLRSINNSIKYLYLSKTKLPYCFFRSYYGIEVLIIEDCGDIASVLFLKKILTIRGLWISGNTKIIDGDFSFLEALKNLQNLFIRDYKHYTHKSTKMWDWKRFHIINKELLFKVKSDRIP